MIRCGSKDARAAAATFLLRHQALIRRRLRHKLTASARTLFDSEDLFSTVARRIDQEVERQRLDILDERHFWALIRRIGENCITDRIREDAAWRQAQGPLAITPSDHVNDPEVESSRGLASVAISAANQSERQMLLLWLFGAPMAAIGSVLGISEGAARKRWQRYRDRTRERFADEGDR
jgi:DNA-directed RNA polymerase specialized sigma24 family protein